MTTTSERPTMQVKSISKVVHESHQPYHGDAYEMKTEFFIQVLTSKRFTETIKVMVEGDTDIDDDNRPFNFFMYDVTADAKVINELAFIEKDLMEIILEEAEISEFQSMLEDQYKLKVTERDNNV